MTTPEPLGISVYYWIASIAAAFTLVLTAILTWNRRLKREITLRIKAEDELNRAIAQDIRQRLAADRELTRYIERLEMIQEVAQFHASNVQELFDFSLEKVIALTESSIGYIYHYSEEEKQFVLNSWSKGVMPSCSVAEAQTIYHLDKTGLWGEVVRQRCAIMVNDYAAPSDLKKGHPEGHVPLSRFLSIPVFDNDRIVAVVGVANKVLPYDQTDQMQLTLMVDGVWKIAARLIMEERITRASHEWHTTFDSISDSIALIDADQRILRCNLATKKLVGRDFKDIINQPCWKLFHDSDVPIPECPMEKAKSSRHSETATIRHLDRWLEVTVEPLLSSSSELTGAVHIVRDITEQVTLLNSLKDLNELFNLFMKYSPIYCYIKEISDSESTVIQASANFVELVDVPAAEMIGKNMHQLFPQEFADKITTDDLKAVTEQRVLRLEVELNGKSYITYKFPIKNTAGQKILADYTIDITELKQSEEAIRVIQQQLMQSDKMATIGQLAAGVAHEINNPMGFVSSNMITLGKYIEKYNHYIELLEQDVRSISGETLPERLLKARKTMKLDYVFNDINALLEENNEGLERVKRIVKDLKIFSRSDTLETASADLNSSIDSTINIVINQIKYCAELKYNYGILPPITCNIQQISQVLMNLLINAAHAIQEKGDEFGEITICTWCDHENVFVSITDSGCGISPDHLGKIFDAFFTTKVVGKGTGLGLSISFEIIRRHGGEILVTSELGVGTTFTVRLPLQPEADAVGPQPKKMAGVEKQ
jgi:PAS domain S-box-containing protein